MSGLRGSSIAIAGPADVVVHPVRIALTVADGDAAVVPRRHRDARVEGVVAGREARLEVVVAPFTSGSTECDAAPTSSVPAPGGVLPGTARAIVEIHRQEIRTNVSVETEQSTVSHGKFPELIACRTWRLFRLGALVFERLLRAPACQSMTATTDRAPLSSGEVEFDAIAGRIAQENLHLAGLRDARYSILNGLLSEPGLETLPDPCS